ncbi:hypothetical protein W97_00843 [Coniosporium apollinis CBS 100218]|uniref:Mitochondrial import receptor subunit TOM5 n=1 Tax=Coniosporium apollinis (strain CBS 100218) TaxID=1168221 RepID=R7YIC7_CONA1|nr:uncharacterized protein W97_00843 [Coniosporium apollinis CBS 100218]EON61628.1 hypothetical protein W97_00843 [Coniosporium apollinis CBS 100218]
MFGGPPPAPSKAELQAQEAEASAGLQRAAATCILLYLSPHIISYIKNLV